MSLTVFSCISISWCFAGNIPFSRHSGASPGTAARHSKPFPAGPMHTSGEFFLPRPWLMWFSLPRSWVFPLLLGDQFLSAACHLVQYVFVEPRNGWIDRWKDEIKSRRHQSTPDGRGPKWAAQTERTAVPCPPLLAASQTPWPPRCSSNLSANGSLGPSCNWPLLATQVSDHPVQSSPPASSMALAHNTTRPCPVNVKTQTKPRLVASGLRVRDRETSSTTAHASEARLLHPDFCCCCCCCCLFKDVVDTCALK